MHEAHSLESFFTPSAGLLVIVSRDERKPQGAVFCPVGESLQIPQDECIVLPGVGPVNAGIHILDVNEEMIDRIFQGIYGLSQDIQGRFQIDLPGAQVPEGSDETAPKGRLSATECNPSAGGAEIQVVLPYGLQQLFR